jgi:hypothetical protein
MPKALLPYLNGKDLNSHPEHEPSRWVINFWDWPLARDAAGSWQLADKRQRERWLREGACPLITRRGLRRTSQSY